MADPAEIQIVPITESHIPGFHAAWDQVARETRFLSVMQAPPVNDVREFVRANLQADNPHLVALAGERVIGWCDIVRQTRPTLNHRGALSVGLMRDWRCLGIGRTMIEQVVALAWARNFKRIDLVSRADNVHAIALYQRLGFEIEGLRHKAFQVEGQYLDLVDMALLHPDLAEADPPR